MTKPISVPGSAVDAIKEVAGKQVLTIHRLPYTPVVSIDKVHPDVIYIRTSERLLFRRCRRLWGWNSPLKMNLEPKSKPDYFWFGTGMHYALEDYHGINQYGHAARAFEAYTMATLATKEAPETWREFMALGIEMMSYYVDYWLINRRRDPLDTLIWNGVPQTEVRFSIDLPIKGPQGQQVKYRGQIDRMIRDENGSIWVGEYKSAKQFRLHHFDTDDQISAYCTPLSTEILTRKGWKKYDELIVGEEVLGYSLEKDCLEWTILQDIHQFMDRQTATYSNKSFSFVATPDHRWVKRSEGWRFGERQKLEPIRMDIQQQHQAILMSSTLDGTLILTPDEAAVLGWLLTDGTHSMGDRASIGQKKYKQEVQTLLDRFPGCYTRIQERDDGVSVWHLSVSFFEGLYKKAGINFQLDGWEQFILGMSLKARQAFCDAAMLGDGSIGNNGQKTFYQKAGTKHQLFKLAFFLCGYFPTTSRVGGIGNSWSEPTENTFNLGTPLKWTRTIKSRMNEGVQDVWCPQTTLGTWVMRQEGQIAITGNCWAAQAIYGEPVMGVIYQQHKKDVPSAPKILSTGKVSTNKTMNTSYALYRQTLIDIYGDPSCFPSDNVRYLNTLVGDEEDEADKYIRRDRIYRNQHQIAAQGEKILMEIEDMLRQELPLYPNPSKDCAWLCPLESVCIAMDDGSDFEGLLTALTTNREEVSDSWRQHLPHPSLLAEAPLRQELQEVTLQELLEVPEPKAELLQLLDLDW